jgi:hypothetical protein
MPIPSRDIVGDNWRHLMGGYPAPVVLLVSILALPNAAAAQAPTPNPSKEQRQALLAALVAVKNAEASPPVEDAWQVHLFRASDGSHYVAFSTEAPPGVPAGEPFALYVRLAPAPDPAATTLLAVRSPVEEWLLGQRNDPLPMRAARVVQVPTGELPVGGPLAGSTRESLGGQNQAALRLMEKDRERRREAEEAAKRARQAEMEGRSRTQAELMPFEDFDFAARVTPRAGRSPLIRRSLTAGPGDYDLYVGWATLSSRTKPPAAGAVKRRLRLPVASTALALGSVIVADAITFRDEIYRADQQAAHPYAIGTTEIEPAADRLFTNDEKLSVAFQVMNAAPSPTGKPDVSVGFRLFRVTANGEQLAGSLTPLEYSERTLPADFNLLLGHPILAAMAAPLGSLPRGDYRLAIAATDRVARTSATAETRFTISATPAALLASAPPYTARVRRARFVDPDILDQSLDALAGPSPSPAVAALLSLARQRQFASLLRDDAAAGVDRGLGLLMQAVARYAIGDTPATVAAQVRRALEAGAPEAAAQFWLGACRAAEGRDEEAVAAWDLARERGWPFALVATPHVEALVRLNRLAEAGSRAAAAREAGVTDVEFVHVSAVADIAAKRYEPAVRLLTTRLQASPEDAESRWLLVHALFASTVEREAPGATPDGRAQLIRELERYLEDGGRHAALAGEWRTWLTSSSASP